MSLHRAARTINFWAPVSALCSSFSVTAPSKPLSIGADVWAPS